MTFRVCDSAISIPVHFPYMLYTGDPYILIHADKTEKKQLHANTATCADKVGIPNFVSGPREYIMEGEYVILGMCSWFRIR